MKIRDIVTEEVNDAWLNGRHYVKKFRIGDYSYQVENTLHSGDVPGINVHVSDPARKYILIAYAYFILQEDGENKWLESDETLVEDDYRGQGIASTMYSLVRSLGFSIKGSQSQSMDGREMWDAWRAKGNDKHLAELAPPQKDDGEEDDLELPYYDPKRGARWIDGVSKGSKQKFANFRTERLNRSWAIMADTFDDGSVKISTTTSKDVAQYIVSQYLMMNQA